MALGHKLRPLAVAVAIAGSLVVVGSGSLASDAAQARPSQPARGSTKPLAWVDSYDAVCVSLVRGVSPRRAVKLLTGSDRRSFASLRAANHWVDDDNGNDSDGYRYWIAAGRIGKWTFLWEDNGYDGSLPPIARRLSAGTTFVSFSWDVNDDEQFTYAVKRRIVRAFDPILDSRKTGVGKALPAERRLNWRGEPEKSMIRLQRSVTKQPLARPQWTRRSGVTYWGSHG